MSPQTARRPPHTSGRDGIVVCVHGEPAGLWERAIPGQLRLPLQQTIGPLIAARTPAPARPEWASEAVTGGVVLCFQDLDVGGRGVARWYGMHLQERLDGGVDVICRWGRLGVRSTRPRQLAEAYPDWAGARDALGGLLARRAARGYQRARSG